MLDNLRSRYNRGISRRRARCYFQALSDEALDSFTRPLNQSKAKTMFAVACRALPRTSAPLVVHCSGVLRRHVAGGVSVVRDYRRRRYHMAVSTVYDPKDKAEQ
jgi:hypothetical protein